MLKKLDQRKYLLIALPMDLINGYEFIFDHDNSLNKDQILVCVLGNARNQNVELNFANTFIKIAYK